MRITGDRVGAAVLVGLGLVHLVVALATGHSARAEVPPDLSPAADELALDPFKAAALLVTGPGAQVVDVRGDDAYARGHLPGARHEAGASAAGLAALAAAGPVVVVAEEDEDALRLVSEARAAAPSAAIHALAGGERAWFLAFELPVPLFSEQPPPYGYEDAMETVRARFRDPAGVPADAALAALQRLVAMDYRPTLLAPKGGPKPAAKRKKVSGGCG